MDLGYCNLRDTISPPGGDPICEIMDLASRVLVRTTHHVTTWLTSALPRGTLSGAG